VYCTVYFRQKKILTNEKGLQVARAHIPIMCVHVCDFLFVFNVGVCPISYFDRVWCVALPVFDFLYMCPLFLFLPPTECVGFEKQYQLVFCFFWSCLSKKKQYRTIVKRTMPSVTFTWTSIY
jgi:hypothetical protein